MKKITAEIPLTKMNDLMADRIRRELQAAGVVGINVMGSPGAGKTSLILALAGIIGVEKVAVIEGDIAGRIDTDFFLGKGIRAVQINTDGMCHLEAGMVEKAIREICLKKGDYLFVENVGNLVCPAGIDIGMHRNLVAASVPEGHDKPYKYPGIFQVADTIAVTKYDVVSAFGFDEKMFVRGVRMVRPETPVYFVSSKTGDGIVKLAGRIADK